MQMTRWALMLAAAGVLAACGGKGPEQPGQGGGTASSKPAPSGAASAEEVAEEARGRVRCPAKPKSGQRPANAPVDDVLGVRPGMSFEDAANLVLCSHDMLVMQTDTSNRFNIQMHGQTIRQGFSARFAEARVVKSSRDYMREMGEDFAARSGNAVRQDMKAGQSKWYVSTMGPAGQETVIAVAREEWFEEGKNPTMANIEQALMQKYGKVTRSQKSSGQYYFWWAYDPAGRPITETSPLFNSCNGNADPDGGTNFSPDCGTAIAAFVMPLRENPDLAQFLQVGVADQANGYERITSTEQGFEKAEAARRAKEVEDASKNSAAPKL